MLKFLKARRERKAAEARQRQVAMAVWLIRDALDTLTYPGVTSLMEDYVLNRPDATLEPTRKLARRMDRFADSLDQVTK